jgi:hypothetical protein
MTRRQVAVAALGLITVAVVAGCRSSDSSGADSDAAVRTALLQGVSQIRHTHDLDELHARLTRARGRLRSALSATADGRRARGLALRGLTSTLRGIESELAFMRNDSGNLSGATRDAMQTVHSRTQGAKLLRAAGRVLGLRLGSLDGY